MIEPTETESKAELDLFVDALISIAKEVEKQSRPGAHRAALYAHQPVDQVTPPANPFA